MTEQLKRRNFFQRNLNQIILQCIALVGIAWYFVFFYFPYYGLTIAFKDFKFKAGIMGSQWIGFKFFQELITDINLPMVVRNTVSISFLKILICFPAAILFAILLNEIRGLRFKKIIQTISFFPHFISWIIISLVITYMFAPEFGLVSNLLLKLGIISKPLNILADAQSFYWLAVFSELWKSTGWSSILFIAAISGIDPTLYEAAVVDGASRLRRIINITLPSITGTIILVFLLQFSSIFSGVGGIFEQSMFLGNAVNYDKSIVLGLYTLRTGIALGRFSYATAVGLVNGVVSLALLLISNAVCWRFFGRGLYTGGNN